MLLQRFLKGEERLWSELAKATGLLAELRSALASLRRECLDFLIPLNERHLRMIVKEWGIHYNRGRPHRSLGVGSQNWIQSAKVSTVADSCPVRLSHFAT